MKKIIPYAVLASAAIFLAQGDDASAKENVACDSTETWTTQEDLKDQISACYKNSETNFTVKFEGDLNPSNAVKEITGEQEYEYQTGTLQSWSYSGTRSGTVSSLNFKMKYLITAEQEKIATDIVNQIGEKVKTIDGDLAKVKYVNDWISKQTVYSKSAKTSPHTIYTIFNENKAVCQAYALATYRILSYAGMDIHYIVGKALPSGEGHAWNTVKIDGKWYNLDVTWNDPSAKGMTGYGFFLMPDNQFGKDHIRSNEFDWYENIKSESNDFSAWNDISWAITNEENDVTYFTKKGTADIYRFEGTDLESAKKVGTGNMYYGAAATDNQLYFIKGDDKTNQLVKIDVITGKQEIINTSKTTDLSIVGDFLYYKAAGKAQRQYIGNSTADYTGLEVISVKANEVKVKIPSGQPTNHMIDLIMPNGQAVALQNPIADGQILTYKYKQALKEAVKGKWQVNGVIYNVLGDVANKKAATAVDTKINAAKKLDPSNKNYVKTILAANTAYNKLTFEQKEFVTTKDTLDELLVSIQDVYKSVQDFEIFVNNINPAKLTDKGIMSDDGSQKGAITQYNALTTEQLALLDANVKKKYLAYVDTYTVKAALEDADLVASNAQAIIDFNKAYGKLSKNEKAELSTNEAVIKLTAKKLQTDANAAITMMKKVPALEIQKKDVKNKALYYVVEDGKKTSIETTTKTIYPVYVENETISTIVAAKKAYEDLGKKNTAAQALVDTTNLNILLKRIDSSVKVVKDFENIVNNIGTDKSEGFVEDMIAAKEKYDNFTADELKYLLDANVKKLYTDYLKTYTVVEKYNQMTNPESSTKSLTVSYAGTGNITDLTNGAKFSKGKFTVPANNYTFTFKEDGKLVYGYYLNGTWEFSESIKELKKTSQTATEIVAYAKVYNALKANQKELLSSYEEYKAFVGKEADYQKAATVEKAITTAMTKNTTAAFQTAKKQYDALTEAQKSYVDNAEQLLKALEG